MGKGTEIGMGRKWLECAVRGAQVEVGMVSMRMYPHGKEGSYVQAAPRSWWVGVHSCHPFLGDMPGHRIYTWGARPRAGLTAVGLSPRAAESGPEENQPLQEQVEVLQGLLKQAQNLGAQQAWDQAEARARQSFLQESQQLLQWAESIQARLHNEEELVDLASAQRLLREYMELQEEIHLRQERSGCEGREGLEREGRKCGHQRSVPGWHPAWHLRPVYRGAEAWVRQPACFGEGPRMQSSVGSSTQSSVLAILGDTDPISPWSRMAQDLPTGLKHASLPEGMIQCPAGSEGHRVQSSGCALPEGA